MAFCIRDVVIFQYNRDNGTTYRQNICIFDLRIFSELIIVYIGVAIPAGADRNKTVQSCVVDLPGETGFIGPEQANSNYPVSGYKIIKGGSRSHADSGTAKGIFSVRLSDRESEKVKWN